MGHTVFTPFEIKNAGHKTKSFEASKAQFSEFKTQPNESDSFLAQNLFYCVEIGNVLHDGLWEASF